LISFDLRQTFTKMITCLLYILEYISSAEMHRFGDSCLSVCLSLQHGRKRSWSVSFRQCKSRYCARIFQHHHQAIPLHQCDRIPLTETLNGRSAHCCHIWIQP